MNVQLLSLDLVVEDAAYLAERLTDGHARFLHAPAGHLRPADRVARNAPPPRGLDFLFGGARRQDALEPHELTDALAQRADVAFRHGLKVARRPERAAELFV